jgi:hypothetical protein
MLPGLNKLRDWYNLLDTQNCPQWTSGLWISIQAQDAGHDKRFFTGEGFTFVQYHSQRFVMILALSFCSGTVDLPEKRKILVLPTRLPFVCFGLMRAESRTCRKQVVWKSCLVSDLEDFDFAAPHPSRCFSRSSSDFLSRYSADQQIHVSLCTPRRASGTRCFGTPPSEERTDSSHIQCLRFDRLSDITKLGAKRFEQLFANTSH